MALSLTRSRVEELTSLSILFATDDNASTFLTADDLEGFDSILICAPATTPVGTEIKVVALASPDIDETADASWRDVHSPSGTLITVANGACVPLTELPFAAIRLESNGTETANQVYTVLGLRKT